MNPQPLGSGDHIKLPVEANVPQVITFNVPKNKPGRGQWFFTGQTFDVPLNVRATYQIDDGPVSPFVSANFQGPTMKGISGGAHKMTVVFDTDLDAAGFVVWVGVTA